jgi:hypothetical protein
MLNNGRKHEASSGNTQSQRDGTLVSSSNNSVNTNTNNISNNVVRTPSNHHHILLIDDSSRVRSLLLAGIVTSCTASGYSCKIWQSTIEYGLVEDVHTLTALASGGKPNNTETHFTIYTADSPRNALPVLKLRGLDRLTIVSDIAMPNDTEVGLVGLLETIVDTNLAVNLLFCSNDNQNRTYVAPLIERGKAYFLEKGSTSWAAMPYALVEETGRFSFKMITENDYSNYARHSPVPPMADDISEEEAERVKSKGGFKPSRFIKNLTPTTLLTALNKAPKKAAKTTKDASNRVGKWLGPKS